MVSIGSIAKYGALGGAFMLVSGIKPKTKGEENFKNAVTSTATLGILATTPIAVRGLVKSNLKSTEKLTLKTGTAIEKVMEYVTAKFPGVVAKIKGTKVGAKLLEYAAKAGTKVKGSIASSPSLKKYAQKAIDALDKFVKAPTKTKGKYALIAAGAGLLAYAALKTIANYYRRDGAIEQKYADK